MFKFMDNGGKDKKKDGELKFIPPPNSNNNLGYGAVRPEDAHLLPESVKLPDGREVRAVQPPLPSDFTHLVSIAKHIARGTHEGLSREIVHKAAKDYMNLILDDAGNDTLLEAISMNIEEALQDMKDKEIPEFHAKWGLPGVLHSIAMTAIIYRFLTEPGFFEKFKAKNPDILPKE